MYTTLMGKTVGRTFFDRPTLDVAKDLLGKYLVRRPRRGASALAVMITEVEAYDGPRDRASHASRGRTPRNRPMFGVAGHFYVYFTYGMHWLANIVTGPEDYPAAILLRGGIYENPHTGRPQHIQGPARLTRFLRVGKAQNARPASRRTGLWFEDRGTAVPHGAVRARRRIGVDYAGPHWANKRYNFSLEIGRPARIKKERRIGHNDRCWPS